MSNIIDKIRVSGTDYTLSATSSGGNPTVELTQAEYDALVSAGTVSADTYYIITDAQAGDLTQYWTSAQTNSAITQATSGKVDTTTFNTYSGSVETALSGKQDTLVSGTNIKTINNESILGSGNITIQGGGKAVSAGTNISVTTGETADTINCTLPLAVGSGSRSLKNVIFGDSIGEASFAMGKGSVTSKGASSFAFGSNVSIDGYGSFGAGINVNTYSNYETVFGLLNNVSGLTEFACGQNCLSRVVDGSFAGYGNSGNTQFIVGNGKQNVALHNAFEVRQSGDIYIVDTNDTSTSNYWEKPMIRLQDYLGGGGSSYTAGSGITIDSNDVIGLDGHFKIVSNNSGQIPSTVGDYIHIGYLGTNIGYGNAAKGQYSLAVGTGNIVGTGTYYGMNSMAAGNSNTTFNDNEFASGQFNVSSKASNTFGDSGNTLFSVGNGTGDNARRNAFEIRQNGDIYVPNTDDTSVTGDKAYSLYPMVRLQDTITATASNTTALGGLKLVKLTQSEYDALATKDSNTLYVING